MLEEHVPRVTLDVIEAVALPRTTPPEVERAVATWHFINHSHGDFHRALIEADLTAAGIVVVELATERASLQDVGAACAAAQLAPCGLIDAIRLVAATEPSRWQPFQFVCLGSVARGAVPTAPVVDCAGGDTVVVGEASLQDDENCPELGWSDHCFMLARGSSRMPAQ